MKLWQGRFTKSSDAAMDDFNSSISFDARMYACDIAGSIAHATMLGEQNIITAEDSSAIVSGLNGILNDINSGKLDIDMTAEDIHMFVETELTSRIGSAGKRLHTGRSRNDQVALDTRLYLRDESDHITDVVKSLICLLCDLSEQHTSTVVSGYTHMQKAQPVTLAHYLMAYAQMFVRDVQRLSDCRKRINILPLGSGALAGTTYPINRERVAELLGFDSVSLNSMDSVSDRDYIIEFCSCLSILMMHLSRFCEELVLWSSTEFGYVEIDDAFATGSSIMPQKKNPDAAELIRGKTGRVYGDLFTLLAIMKNLPLAYNKDMQEDKPALFDSIDTTLACLEIFIKMLKTAHFNTARMLESAEAGFTNATDAADYLVKKGVPFRDAHEILGKLVLYCINNKKSLSGLSLSEYKTISDVFDNDIYDAISMESCINMRCSTGGPAPGSVLHTINETRKFLK